jgi:hypothetical protein
MVWKESLSVGFTDIGLQHKALINAVKVGK